MAYTQTEIDNLCLSAQSALVLLMNDFVVMCRRKDLYLKKRFAQMLQLNNLMRSVQDYDYANWSFLTDAEFQEIQEKILYLSEWRD